MLAVALVVIGLPCIVFKSSLPCCYLGPDECDKIWENFSTLSKYFKAFDYFLMANEIFGKSIMVFGNFLL